MTSRTPNNAGDEHIAKAPNEKWPSPLERLLALWGLSTSEAARTFGVSRQVLSSWRQHGVPTERVSMISDLEAATHLLERHVVRECIPTVVRRRADNLGGRSLYDLACEGRHRELPEAVAEIFDLRRVQP